MPFGGLNEKAPFRGLWYAFSVQDDDDYPFTAWDDLKFAVWGLFGLLFPFIAVVLVGLILFDLLT
jgi:hypothetical protein